MKKIISLILIVALLCCGLAGCASKETPEKAAETKAPQASKVPGPTTTNPLTGEEIGKDISMARPYCVMINNHTEGRPSIGLSNASIIYEALVEGDITRLMAIFNDIDGLNIGNIRSCRHYYLSLVQAYHGIYIHWGSSTQGEYDIRGYSIDELDALKGVSAFYRESFRYQNEHNAMIDGTKAVEYAKDHYDTNQPKGFDSSYGLSFSDDAAKQCIKKSTDFTVQYLNSTKTEFKYNKDKDCYNPYMGGKEYIDRGDYNDKTDDKSIDIKNVIILNVPYTVIDDVAHKDMELTGSGTGFYATGGKYVEIKWTRDGRYDFFHYTLADGTPLNLGVGKTYICISPLDKGGSVTW